jgi:hypothetical protein
MTTKTTCPECKVPMAAGFIVDVTHGARLPARWIEGAPERGWSQSVKTKGKACFEIQARRCPQCGLLRSYATKKAKPPSVWGY